MKCSHGVCSYELKVAVVMCINPVQNWSFNTLSQIKGRLTKLQLLHKELLAVNKLWGLG